MNTVEAVKLIEKDTDNESQYNSESYQRRSRSLTEKSYVLLFNRNFIKDVDLLYWLNNSLYQEFTYMQQPTGRYVCNRPLLFLEKEHLTKSIMPSETPYRVLEKLEEIIQKLREPTPVKVEEKIEPTLGAPDEYFVEGIYINWKSAFQHHNELNKLRQKHGIKQV